MISKPLSTAEVARDAESIQWTERTSPRRIWQAIIATCAIGAFGVFGFFAFELGPLRLAAGLWLLWPAYLLFTVLIGISAVSLTLAAEPSRVGTSAQGVTFVSPMSKVFVKWSEFVEPQASWQGIGLRRVVKTPLGTSRPGQLLSTELFQAIVRDPHWPNLPLSDRVRRRAKLPDFGPGAQGTRVERRPPDTAETKT